MEPLTFTFPERDGDPAGELWLPETEHGPAPADVLAPAVVLAPDLLGRPGKGLASALAPELARRGYVALTAPPTAGVETGRFREATLRERVGDVARAVTALFERMAAGGRADIRRIALVGHGAGGTVAAAEAAHDERVGAVVLLGAPRTPATFFPRKATQAWQKGSSARLRDEATGEDHELGPELWRDWTAREAALDHAATTRETRAHVLWVHGTADERASVEDSRRAYWKHPDAGRRARLVEIAGAGHDFGVGDAAVPGDLPPAARKVADAIQEVLEAAFPRRG